MKDSIGRDITYLRLSVTDLCNLRCRYCMPEEGVAKRAHSEMLTQDEMVAAVRAAARLGVRKLRLTGGEPLVKPGIVDLCRRCAAVEGIEEVCLTTNGTLLPPLAEALRKAGVSRVNISLDTLRPQRYRAITRRGELREALAGVESAVKAGFRQVKINAVLMGGVNDDEIPDLAELTRTLGVDVRFIELMPMVDGAFSPASYVPGTAVLRALPDLREESADGGVAKLYRLPGAAGRVGLISPVHDSFCHRCNRLRITADGMVKPCLHSPGEFPLKGLTEAEMAQQLRRAIDAKPRAHGDLTCGCLSGAGRAMNEIGG